MRITHRRKKEEPKKNYRHNESITAPEVLVLDKGGANLGIMPIAKAIGLARENGLDLVEINPLTTPPVVKIIDFGQLRYQQEKEARLAKAHQHVVDIKGVRLSLRIGPHDLDIRRNQTLKFLDGGDKVKIEIILRGRELSQGPMAVELVKKFITSVNELVPIRTEQQVERNANKVTAIITKS
jgi:translation initiation factor IF-3